MIYTESATQAVDIARLALDELAAAAIAPNPTNFAIFYEYFSGRNAALRQAYDALRARGEKISAAHVHALYDQFFGEPASSIDVNIWCAQIQATASQIIDTLALAGENTADYGAALQKFSGNLSGAQNVADVRSLIDGIIAATRAMDGHVRRLQNRVEGSTREIVELRQKLEITRMEALTDGLTGIANRKCFDERLTSLARLAAENGESLSLVLADIDNFKRINDRFGHPFGDRVLKLVARTLFEGVKGRDTAARFGGEEFALILPSTPLAGAVVVAESMRKAIAAKKLARKGSNETLGVITLSFGATEFAPGEPVADFVRRADDLLYRAKRLGRNRVVAEGGPESVARAV